MPFPMVTKGLGHGVCAGHGSQGARAALSPADQRAGCIPGGLLVTGRHTRLPTAKAAYLARTRAHLCDRQPPVTGPVKLRRRACVNRIWNPRCVQLADASVMKMKGLVGHFPIQGRHAPSTVSTHKENPLWQPVLLRRSNFLSFRAECRTRQDLDR